MIRILTGDCRDVLLARERLQTDCPLFADITDAPVPEPPEDERMADLFTEAAE